MTRLSLFTVMMYSNHNRQNHHRHQTTNSILLVGTKLFLVVLLLLFLPESTQGWTNHITNNNHRQHYALLQSDDDDSSAIIVVLERRLELQSSSLQKHRRQMTLFMTKKSNVHEKEEEIEEHVYNMDDDDVAANDWEEAEGEGMQHDDDEEEEEEDDDEDVDSDEEDEDDANNNSELQQEYELWCQAVEKSIQDLQKKQRSLESELNKSKNMEDTMKRAQLIVNNLYMFTSSSSSPSSASAPVIVQDWENDGVEVELTLNPKYSSASEEADALFAQVRKLKRGSTVVERLLEETTQHIEFMKDTQLDIQSITFTNEENDSNEGTFRIIQDRLKRSADKTNFHIPSLQEQQERQKKQRLAQQRGIAGTTAKRRKPKIGTPASNIRKFRSPNGYTILVGRNRRGNEYLSCSKAKGNDIWMHARGTPGAHVLILSQGGKTSSNNEECLQYAANLAAFYSDARTEQKAFITVAEPKHVLKPRNAPLGAVKLRQELKVIIGNPQDVPDEIKEAREESGLVNDEFLRSADRKAKHRAKQNKKKNNNKNKNKK